MLRDLVAALRETSEDVDSIAATFVAAVLPADADRAKKALGVLLPAYVAGSIYNAEFQDLKTTIDRIFERAFDALVRTDYTTYWEPDKQTVSAKGKIANELGFASGIRSSIAIAKKAAKLKLDHSHLDAIKQFLAACVPLAQIFEKLKKMTVKGRKPPSPEQAAKKAAQLANKIIKTCACCFRPIAVLPNGFIADHGYTLPFQDGKTASCPGRQFQPLEVSSDGLVYMIKALKTRLLVVQKALTDAPEKTSLLRKTYSKKLGTPVQKGDAEWNQLFRQYVGELENERDYTTGQLRSFETKLAAWKPKATESISDLTSQLRVIT